MSSGRILVVEDEPLLSDMLRRELERDGHHVRTAPDGRMALEALETEEPDLLLLDLLLPDVDGLQIMRKVREKRDRGEKTFPVMVLSNLGHESHRRLYEDLGVSTYLIKSNIDVDAVPNEVRKCLEEWKTVWED